MPGQRSPDVIQVNLRVPKELRKRLVAAAKASGLSLNAEMVDRLERTFEREKADEILDEAHRLFDGAERMNKETAFTFAELEKKISDFFPPRNALLARMKK